MDAFSTKLGDFLLSTVKDHPSWHLSVRSLCLSFYSDSTRTHGLVDPFTVLSDNVMSTSLAVRYVPLNTDSPAVFRGARASNYLTSEWGLNSPLLVFDLSHIFLSVAFVVQYHPITEFTS
jgi:hypothetical protein